MYPNFKLIFEALLGYKMPSWLGAINTFGFFAIIAFIAAVHITINEIKRHEKEGNLRPVVKRKIIGNAPTVVVLFLLITIAFIVGFAISELLWLITTSGNTIIKSELRDHLILGLAAAFSIGYVKYRQIKRQQLAESKIVAILVFPHQRITGLLTLTITAGFLGPKIFQLVTTWPHFIDNPLDNIFSGQGLTFYGGLICAFFTVYFFSRKTKVSFSRLCDAAAPGMMLAYAIRRLGCHFSGDGDWGIFNSAYVTDENGKLFSADLKQYQKMLELTAGYFKDNFENFSQIPHTFISAHGWIPRWLVAMNYPHNLVQDGILLKNCEGQFCTVLPVSVLPVSLYESIICMLLFFFLWFLRKHLRHPFQLFGLYLLLAGVERFLIEKIRINYSFESKFINLTQPEMISLILVVMGTILFFTHKKLDKANYDF